MKKKELKSFTLQDAVYNDLASALASGEIPPGESITVKQVADRYNVSPMPVREALGRLEAKGLIKVSKSRRMTVNQLSLENLRQIVEIRLMLESYAAEKASKNRSEESLQELEVKLAQYAAVNDPEKHTKILDINEKFHQLIYQEAHLPLLNEIIGMLWERARPYLAIEYRNSDNLDLEELIKIHRGMLNGLREKNPHKVKRWLKIDITHAAERISKQIS